MFLTLFGLPFEELPRFLSMKDGIIRPDVVTGVPTTVQRSTPPAGDGRLHLRILQRSSSTSASRRGEADILSRFLDAEVDGEKLTREDILDICFLFLIAGLDTVTATLDCIVRLPVRPYRPAAARSSRTLLSSLRSSRSCSGGKTPVRAWPTWRSPIPRWAAARSTRGQRHRHDRLGQHRRGRPRSTPTWSGSTGRPTAMWPSEPACTDVSGPTWPAWNPWPFAVAPSHP